MDGRAVTVELSGGSFTLYANNTAFADLEDSFDGELYDVIVNRFLKGKVKIRETCKIAACLARAHHPDVNGEAILKAAPQMEDAAKLRVAIMEAIFKALPPKPKKGEATGEPQKPRPTETK